MATFGFFFFFCTLMVFKKACLFVVHLWSRSLSAEKKKEKLQNEGKNKLYNQMKLAMYVFVSVLFFLLSIKVNVIVTLK